LREQLVKFPALAATTDAKSAWKAQAPVFADPRSQRTLQELERIAPTGATVLIVGETGTGKERAARHIHERSHVSGPFVAVNCAALNESLVDAELFGHESGAFTGALHARPGWFEAANGGTLFLDEIGDMPLRLQQRLLRVLQERQVVRIGSRKPVPIDVRIVAATNVELERALETGQFRRDLYYRLNVAGVKLLPLRERRGDILDLARHFLEIHREQLNLEHAALTATAEQALLAHAWPGNIRELENVIQVSLIMGRGGVIDAADLRLEHAAPNAAVRRTEAPAAGNGRENGGEDELTELDAGLRRLLNTGRQDVYREVERLLLTTAFEHCAGNQVQTARRLGVSRNIVRAQLKRFGLLAVGP
jgi:sigma-54-specific transcriptional regulator